LPVAEISSSRLADPRHRVRREDLNESDVSRDCDSDSEADAQIRAQLEARVARSLGLDLEDGPTQQQAITPSSHKAAASWKTEDVEMNDGQGAHTGPEEYDFCLFGGAGAAPTKVVLEDDSEPQGEGAILKQRPASFYLAKDLSEEQRQRFKAAAVTGDEVLARSQSRWWSMELPWKVTRITTMTTTKKKVGSGQNATAISTSLESTEAKRKRPGKKRRIALRMKERAEKDKMKTAAQLKEEKEEHLKEKKKRLNRLKKLKRREKEREKKQAAAKGGQGAADSGNDSDGSGSS
jgi:hypothetical protein